MSVLLKCRDDNDKHFELEGLPHVEKVVGRDLWCFLCVYCNCSTNGAGLKNKSFGLFAQFCLEIKCTLYMLHNS